MTPERLSRGAQNDGRLPAGRSAPQPRAAGGGGGSERHRQGGEAPAARNRGRAVDEPAQHEVNPQGTAVGH